MCVGQVKETFQSLITSRRRYERIASVRDLILVGQASSAPSSLLQELEKQLVIFPEVRGISYLGSVLHCVEQTSGRRLEPALLSRLEELTRQLEPVAASSPAPLQGGAVGLPARLVARLGRDLERAGGRDWEHLATGLGLGLEERELVRVRQGEVDRIEREAGGNVLAILKAVIQRFEERCVAAGVQQDLVEHISTVLESEEVFEPPLRRLAREVREDSRAGAK